MAQSVGNRYVALIDILGFRSLLASTPVIEVIGRIDNLLSDAQRYLRASTGSGQVRTLGEVHFSDTILMWTPLIKDIHDDQEIVAGGHLFFVVTDLIYRSFIAGIPLRAGIGFGECCIDVDRQIFVGRAIVDAYEVESAQDWVGGALHPSVPFGIAYAGSLVKYAVPVKTGAAVVPEIALNWPDCPDSPVDHKFLKKTVDAMLAAAVPMPTRVKMENTRAFVEVVQNRIRYQAITRSGELSDWFNPVTDPDPTQ